MNKLENWFCGSALWRYVTRKQLLPWVLEGVELGDHVLEIGAGPGAATGELRKRAARVTSLEYDQNSVLKLAARNHSGNGAVLRGDAAALPFPNGTFSACIAILVFHHLRSIELQDRAFAEIYRVLRPGGILLSFEIVDDWFNRVIHIKSTFVPVSPQSVSSRLAVAGFSDIAAQFQGGNFRIQAVRAHQVA
jgi:SAM-dependent methyltransferase